ncbi:hypothetical protein QTP86_033977 [Hemibagrus guttatus]|nr:hypothetical protein QTP86_033977 [Hemibagrus guttatus]
MAGCLISHDLLKLYVYCLFSFFILLMLLVTSQICLKDASCDRAQDSSLKVNFSSTSILLIHYEAESNSPVSHCLFEDKPCNNKYYFFCHTPYTVRQQVMKLQFRGDDSVFDPASQAAILQQIKQKLKDHGIVRETNVTWRVEPDGNIFHKKTTMNCKQISYFSD